MEEFAKGPDETSRSDPQIEPEDGALSAGQPDEPFEIVMWPQSGEYANQTYFVTDDDAPKHLEIRRDGHVSDLIAFSADLLPPIPSRLSERILGFRPCKDCRTSTGATPTFPELLGSPDSVAPVELEAFTAGEVPTSMGIAIGSTFRPSFADFSP